MSLGNESSASGEAQPLLRLAGLRKSYDSVHALRWDPQSTLDLRAGEVLGIIGENGAGKSTLLSLLTGTIHPDAGSIQLAGKSYSASGPFDALKHGVALIPQETLLSPTLTVAENVLLGREREYGRFGIVNGRRRDRLARDAMSAIGLDLPLHAIVRDLPIEQQKLIELARALAAEPDVLLVDETSNVLGHVGVELLFDRLHRHVARGGGVVIVSHNLDEILQHCDRIAVLRDGHLVATVDNGPGVTSDGLARGMVGREIASDVATSGDRSLGDDVLQLSELRGHQFGPVNVTIRAGEIVGVGGLVGCGAQELARTVAGDLRPQSGSMLVCGRRLRRHSVTAMLDAGVVYVPKDRDAEGLILAHSVRDNLLLSSLPRLTKLATVWPRTGAREGEWIGQRMRLRAASHRVPVSTLSGGNRQKVVLGKAMMHTSSLLVLDNPTRGVDIGAKKEIYDVIREMRADGAAVLLISDELPELRRLVDRLIIMRGGEVTATHSLPLPDEQDLIGDMV